MVVWGIVVAAGVGQRFGRPKQFVELGGKRVIDWSIDAARAACAGVVVAVPSGPTPDLVADRIVPGGSTRSASVRCALAVVPADADIVVVHDAARPLASAGLF